MAEVTFKGSPVHTVGELPAVGQQAPDFLLTKRDLSDISLKDLAGQWRVLNIFPSIDTPVCATSVRRFNSEIDKAPNATVLCVSRDLPFAHERFCGAEGIEKAITASEMRHRRFGEDYGIAIADGPLAGLLARAVVVMDPEGKVVYTQLVPEIAEEPDYEKALAAIQS